MRKRFFSGMLLCFLAISVATSLVGCGGEETAGTVPVGGTVVLDGQPVDGASVAFIGKGGARIASAQTDKEGKFKLRASLGKNGVTVSKADDTNVMVSPAASDEPQLMPSGEEYAKMPKPKPKFPSKYADPKTSGLAFDVVEGMEDLEISLTSK